MYGARRLTAAKMKRADSRIEKPSLSKSPKRPGALTAKKGTPKAKAPKYSSKNPKPMGPGGLKPGALGFLKNKYEKK
jgi:hypothetical protein